MKVYRMKLKYLCLIVFLITMSTIISSCKASDDNTISPVEIKSSDVYAHMYYNLYNETLDSYPARKIHAKKNNFLMITDNQEKLTEILANVEVVRPFEDSETIDYTKGDPFLLLERKNIRYIFYLYDADQFISLHSEHRYHPLLWVERIESKKNGKETRQGWHCTLNAADYASIINLTYNYDGILDFMEIPMGLESITLDWRNLFDGKSELGTPLNREPVLIDGEKLDMDVLLGSKVMAFENSSAWFYYADDPAYCRTIEDDAMRSELIRIMTGGKAFSPAAHFQEQILLGGDGEPSIVFFQEKDQKRIEHIISFSRGAEQMEEDYLFYDSPVVTITRSVRVKDKSYYNLTESSAYRYILSPKDYRWLYELTQY